MQRLCFGSNQLTTLPESLGHLEKQAMGRGRSRYSRSRSREEKQEGSSREENACADDKSKKAYKCGMCRRPFLEGVWQDWKVVREEKGTHNLLDPTYPDAKVGGIRRWAAVCRGCQLAEIVATLFPEGIV